MYFLEVAVHVRDPALVRAIFNNWCEKGFDEMEFSEEDEGRSCVYIHRLFEDDACECIEVIMDLSMQLEVWGRMFLTGVDPRTGVTTLHHGVKAGIKKWIEACVKAGVKPSFFDLSGKSVADMADDEKIKKFLDITVPTSLRMTNE